MSKKKEEVAACKNVPLEVEYEMKMSLESVFTYKNKTIKSIKVDQIEGGEREVEINAANFGTSITSSSIAQRGNIISYFPPLTTPGAQPSIKSVMAGRRTIEMADRELVNSFTMHAFHSMLSTLCIFRR